MVDVFWGYHDGTFLLGVLSWSLLAGEQAGQVTGWVEYSHT